MAGIRNPRTIRWRHDGKNTDGSSFDPAQFGGWQLDINGAPSVSVPIGWEADGEYEAPVTALELPEGDYRAAMRLVKKDPVDPSKVILSDPSNVIDFEIRAVPSAPFDLSVA